MKIESVADMLRRTEREAGGRKVLRRSVDAVVKADETVNRWERWMQPAVIPTMAEGGSIYAGLTEEQIRRLQEQLRAEGREVPEYIPAPMERIVQPEVRLEASGTAYRPDAPAPVYAPGPMLSPAPRGARSPAEEAIEKAPAWARDELRRKLAERNTARTEYKASKCPACGFHTLQAA